MPLDECLVAIEVGELFRYATGNTTRQNGAGRIKSLYQQPRSLNHGVTVYRWTLSNAEQIFDEYSMNVSSASMARIRCWRMRPSGGVLPKRRQPMRHQSFSWGDATGRNGRSTEVRADFTPGSLQSYTGRPV